MSTAIKMQDVSFSNIEEFLLYLPEEERRIVDLLRKIIFSCQPDIVERLTYNVPFYRHHKNICFIWPAAVLWGKKKSYKGVRLGFTTGHLLTDEIQYLEKGNRKFMSYRDFISVKEIDPDLLRSYLFEAILIDEELQKNKIPLKKYIHSNHR